MSLSSGARGWPGASTWERSVHGVVIFRCLLISVSAAGLKLMELFLLFPLPVSAGLGRGAGEGAKSVRASGAPLRAGPLGRDWDLLPGPSMLPCHRGPDAFGWTVYFSSGYTDSKLLKWPLEQVCGLGTSASPLDRQDPGANLGQCRVWGGEDRDRTPPQLGVEWGCHINWGHLVGTTEAIGLRPVGGPGVAPSSHQGLGRGVVSS